MPPTGSDTTLISKIHHSLIRESDLVGSPDTRRLASMQRIDVAKLVERWRRGGIQGQEDDDEGEAVAEDEGASGPLEDLGGEGVVGVGHEENGGGDMDHSVGSDRASSNRGGRGWCEAGDGVVARW